MKFFIALLILILQGYFAHAGADKITNTYSLIMREAGGANQITIVPPALSVDYTLTWPTTAGAANQALTTNGSGVLSWSNLAVAYPIAVVSGGTGIGTYTKGDTLYSDNTNSLAKLGIGTSGQTLAVSSAGTPYWAAAGLSNPLTASGATLYAGSVVGGAGVPSQLLIGTSGQLLTVSSAGTPYWGPAALTNPMTASGAIIYANAALAGVGTPAQLAIGSSGQLLTVSSAGTPYWGPAALANPTTASGAMLYASAVAGGTGTLSQLAIGSAGMALAVSTNGFPYWISSAVTSRASGIIVSGSVSVTSTCTSSPCTVAVNSENLVTSTSVTRSGTGTYPITFATPFSSAPVCTATSMFANAPYMYISVAPTTTGVTLKGLSGSTFGLDADTSFSFTCRGLR